MSASSPDEFKSAFGTFEVPLPSGLTATCRRPDLQDLIFHHALPLELVATIMKESGLLLAQGGPDTDPDGFTERFLSDSSSRFAEFVDRWVCLATLAPALLYQEDAHTPTRVVLEADPTVVLPLHAKLAIFHATFDATVSAAALRRRAAAAEFRVDAPPGAPPGHDSEAVRDTPVGVAGDAGSD